MGVSVATERASPRRPTNYPRFSLTLRVRQAYLLLEGQLPMNDTLPPQALQEFRKIPKARQAVILGRIALAVVLAIVGFSVIKSFVAPREEPVVAQEPGTFLPTKAQAAGLKIMPVTVVSFHSQQITDGKIATNDDTTTPVFSPYSGRVTRLIAKAGDVVKQGQALFAIEATEFVQAQNDLITAVSGVKTAEAQLKLAQANEKRQHEVYDARGGALKDWLQSQSDLVNAEGSHRTAGIALAAVRNRLRILGKTEGEISAIENAPESIKMDAEALVPAPVGGTVIQRQISVGQYINSAANGAASPVYAVGNLSAVWLVANVREVDAPAMHVGQPVEVKVLAYPDRIFKAHLTYVGAVVDDATRRVTVRAEVGNADGALKPEMFASFRIITSDDSLAPGVPEMAVVYEGDTAHVWVARDDGRIVLRPIRAGRTVDGMVEVLDGLKSGEKIVTSGTLFIDRAADNA
jgi:cobalt-zinc-cadmium efflux system membrane fusion protein